MSIATAVLTASQDREVYLLSQVLPGEVAFANTPTYGANMQVGVYTRLSNDPDGTADATARQLKAAKKWCKERGWQVLDHYEDSDYSAYRKGVVRPEFERLMADIEQRKIDTVVVWAIDRFTRRPEVLERFLGIAEGNGCRIESVTESFPAGTTGTFMLRMMVNFANLSSAQTSKRLRDKWENRAADGLPGGGARPFGYSADRMTAHPTEAPALQQTVASLLAGSSLQSECDRLNRDEILSVQGRQWTRTTLKSAILRPRNIALRQHQGQIVGPAQWEPILSDADYHAVEAILTSPGRRAPRYGNVYVLSGLALCGACLTPLGGGVMKKRGGHRRYACVRRGGCGGVGIYASLLEEYVIPRYLALTGEVEGPTAEDPAPLRRKLAAANASLAELAEMLGAGDFTRAEYVAARRPLAETVERLTEQLRSAEEAWADHGPVNVPASWEDTHVETQRRMLKVAIVKVLVHPVKDRSVKQPEPGRIEVVWR